MTKITEPGIYENIEFKDYDAIDAISRRLLGHRSLAHAKVAEDTERADTKAFNFGRALHDKLLFPEKFAALTVEKPVRARRSKVDKEFWEQFEEKHSEKTLLSASEANCIGAMSDTAMKNDLVRALLARCRRELTLVWRDEETQLLCKGRLDLFDDETLLIGEIKTTLDASPRRFASEFFSYQYHRQAAWYWDGAVACGLRPKVFWCLAMEKSDPYAHAIYDVSGDPISIGQKINRRSLNVLAAARKAGEYTAYPGTPQPLPVPEWAAIDAGQILTDTMESY